MDTNPERRKKKKKESDAFLSLFLFPTLLGLFQINSQEVPLLGFLEF